MIQCKVICASQERLLSYISENGITIHKLKQLDALTIVIFINRKDYKTLYNISQKFNAEIELLSETGLFARVRAILKRPVLVFGFILWAALLFFLPTRIFLLFVTGNEKVCDKQILEVAENCGIYFGSIRRELRSERIKNALLSQIPDLQWVGVNTYGCVAEIVVKEKATINDVASSSDVCSIVADRDGIISEVVAEKGTALCTVGQAVSKSQILISGFTDCGFVTRAEHAKGKVYAYTNRKISALSPIKQNRRIHPTLKERKIFLKIGKNIINLSFSSGISDRGCVKMYKEKYLQLPGGFRLPIALVLETEIFCSITENSLPENKKISDLMDQYLQTQMIDGEILNRSYKYKYKENVLHFEAIYLCEEMIGKERYEETPIWKRK